jgi:hypothetical protein
LESDMSNDEMESDVDVDVETSLRKFRKDFFTHTITLPMK